MSAQELTKLFEAGDLYGLMLATVRAWLEKDHPAALYATVVYSQEGGTPDGVVPVTLPDRPLFSPLPVHA